MPSRRKGPLAPYLGILCCLFVLSITAPKAWNRRSSSADTQPGNSDWPSASLAQRANLAYETVDTGELRLHGSSLDPAIAPAIETFAPAMPAVSAAANVPLSGVDLVFPPAAELTSTEPEAFGDRPPAAIADDTQMNLPIRVGDAAPPTASATTTTPAAASRETAIDSAPLASEPTFVAPLGPYAAEVRDPANSDSPSQPHDERLATPNRQRPAAAPEPAPINDRWPRPAALLAQLTELHESNANLAWPQAATQLIDQLCSTTPEESEAANRLIAQLRVIGSQQSSSTAANAPSDRLESCARWALTRWVDLWSSAVRWDQVPEVRTKSESTSRHIVSTLVEVSKLTGKSASGQAWQKYLELDRLQKLAAEDAASDEQRRVAARRVLSRLNATHLSEAQREFLATPLMTSFQAELRGWAAEHVSSQRLLTHVEQYERTGLPHDGKLVANDVLGLRWSASPEATALGQRASEDYCNANVRVAIAATLLNRLIPQPQAVEAPVSDVVLNVPTFGRSTTFTKLSVKLVPDPHRIRLGFEARGLVASDTVSSSGPATFYNEGQSTFLVRKLLVLGPSGLSVWPAVAEADSSVNYLRSIETDFDGVPLVGSLVRTIARNQYDGSREQARFEVEQKLSSRAREQLDSEIRPLLVRTAEDIQRRQVATINRLGLELIPIELATTEERITARMRLSGSQQLGAHTPRPRAPSDSLISLQIHQTALNNVLEQLDLGGRSFLLHELFQWIGTKLGRPQLAQRDDLEDGVRVTFAKDDPVRVRCEGGQVEITLAFAEVSKGPDKWRNFNVQVRYAPQPEGRDPRLGREGTISLQGKSIRSGEVGLRTVFNKIFSSNHDLSLLEDSLIGDPRLADLEISQFVVEDGWIGLAYSQRRVPAETARRPTRSAVR